MTGDNKMYLGIAWAVAFAFISIIGGLVRACDNGTRLQETCIKAGRPGPECMLLNGGSK